MFKWIVNLILNLLWKSLMFYYKFVNLMLKDKLFKIESNLIINIMLEKEKLMK